MYKVHVASTSGFWPCGATDPHLTSDDPDEITCHLCKQNLVWRANNQERIADANAYLEANGMSD